MSNKSGPLHSQWLNGSLIMYPQSIFGTEYCVDGNAGLDTNSGLDWDNAFKTIAAALAASHADIATTNHWDRRNRIYVNGGAYAENLTKFAQKTDVIGVGSTNQHPRARIDGTHILEAESVTHYMGCRFFNIEFYGASAAAVVTLPANQNGIEFHECVFSAVDGATIGLQSTSNHDLVVENCRFDPNTSGTLFATAAINISAAISTNVLIKNNRISGAKGIVIANSTYINCWITDNDIYATTLLIDDNSAVWRIVNNRMISAAAKGTLGTVLDYNPLLAANNFVTGSDGSIIAPVITNNFGAQS